jgi:hypothetical protein
MSLGAWGRLAARVIRAGTLAVVHLMALVGPVLAASPSPTTGIGGDPRSSGQGPGLVGDPLFAIVAVVAIAVAAVALTLAYVRLTDRRSG